MYSLAVPITGDSFADGWTVGFAQQSFLQPGERISALPVWQQPAAGEQPN
jgi:hypothetical protein